MNNKLNDKTITSKIDGLIQKLSKIKLDNAFELKWLKNFFNSKNKNIVLFGDNNNGQFALLNKLFNDNIIPDEVITLGSSLIFTLQTGVEKPIVIKSDGSIVEFECNEFKIEQIINHNDIFEVILPYKYKKEYINISTYSSGYFDKNIYNLYKTLCSDRVVFTINASQAFSMGQKDILKRFIDNGSDILISVTGLELIQEKEKEKVVRYISKVKEEYFPALKILFFETINENSYTENIEKLKSFISDFEIDDSISKNRTFIINKRLNSIIDDCIEALENKRKTILEVLENKKNEEEVNREKLLVAQQYWEDLRIEFEKKANNCIEFVYEELYKIKQIVSEQLQYELVKSNNPKEWWANDLPFRIKKEFVNNSKGLEKTLQARIISDYRWLIEKAKIIYAKTLTGTFRNEDFVFDDNNALIIPKAEDLKDLKLIRYITMAGTGTASVAMFFVVGPIGAVVSAVGGILGDRYITREIKSQQDKLKMALDQIIDDIIEKSRSGIFDKIYEGYDKIIKATVESEEQWKNEITPKITEHPEEKEIISIQNQIDSLESMK